jgi:hypothetical protein
VRKKCAKDTKGSIQISLGSIVEMDKQTGAVHIKKIDGNEPAKDFTFDSVYDWKY